MEKKNFYKITIDDTPYESMVTPKFLKRKAYTPCNDKHICAIIPGVIQDVFVKKGQQVKRNDNLLILEAMKMKNSIAAPHSGVIKALNVKIGDMVTKGQILMEFE